MEGNKVFILYISCMYVLVSQRKPYLRLESAKLRALRTKNALACQRALRAYVLTYQHALCAYMPSC